MCVCLGAHTRVCTCRDLVKRACGLLYVDPSKALHLLIVCIADLFQPGTWNKDELNIALRATIVTLDIS